MAYFLMVATGVFLSTMDSSMMNIALPYIMTSFSTTLAKAEWVVLMYLLTISVSLLIWGKLSDRFGKGVVYLLGIAIFSIGALFCYLSPSLLILVLSRFVQGFGAAMMMSTGPAIIRITVPRDQIGQWMGSLGIATSMGLMTGPLLGGYILHNYNWRTIFILNVPISLLVFLFGWQYLAGTLPKYTEKQNNFDWKGSVLWGVLISVSVLMLNGYFTRNVFGIFISICVIAVLILYFMYHEARQADPLIPITLIRRRYYGVAMVSAALSFAVLFFVLILMPFYLHYIKELSFDKVGYMMMAVPVSLFIVSPVSGRLFDRFGAVYLTVSGMVITGCAVLLLSMVNELSTLVDIGWRLSLLGCGQSVFLSPNTASVLSRVNQEDAGITAGMLATCRNMGMLVGVALVGLLFSKFYHYFSSGLTLTTYSMDQLPYFMKAFSSTLWIASLLAFITAIISYQRK